MVGFFPLPEKVSGSEKAALSDEMLKVSEPKGGQVYVSDALSVLSRATEDKEANEEVVINGLFVLGALGGEY